MKRFLIFLILLLQILCSALAFAAPEIPAKPTAASGIYIQDYAGVMQTADKQKILSIGQDLDNKTTAQIAVITLKTLDNQPIEDYALAVLRAWGIGSKEKNNGVLIVVATEDRRSRMEVGYGLEGVLTDGITGRIQDQYMLPYFRTGNYSKGILQGYAATAALVAKSEGVELTGVRYQGGSKKAASSTREFTLSDLLLGGVVIVLLIIDNLFLGGFFTRMLIFSLFRRGGGGGGFGGGGFGGGSGGGGGSSRRW